MADLRRIKPIGTRKLKANAVVAARPRFAEVDPSTLLVDESYQREISDRGQKLIRSIVEGWDWTKFKPPVVVETPEGLQVIDGQHTAIAAATHNQIAKSATVADLRLTKRIGKIPVMVVSADSVEARAKPSSARTPRALPSPGCSCSRRR
jgi:hypothetical protein